MEFTDFIATYLNEDMEDAINIFNILAIIGSFMVLYAYLMNLQKKWASDSYQYLSINAIASAFLVISLLKYLNIGSLLLECIWLAISLYGMLQRYQSDKKDNEDTLNNDNKVYNSN